MTDSEAKPENNQTAPGARPGGSARLRRLAGAAAGLWRVRAARLAAAVLLLAVPLVVATWFMTREPAVQRSHLDEVNLALIKGDEQRALEYARKMMAAEPENIEAIFTVASLVKERDPAEARALYGWALELYAQHNNPDVSGQPILIYWVAAGLAEDAGQTERARRYYQMVIDAANRADNFEANLIEQSQAALERLR